MVLVHSCCRFISLSAGSLAIGIFIVITSILAVMYIIDISDEKYWSFKNIVLSEAMAGGVATSCVLIVIGVVVIGAWIWKKYKIIKWASIALLICTAVRIMIAIWRCFEGKNVGSFLLVFFVTLFYFYGFVVLWSFYQEERDLEFVRSLPDYYQQPLNLLREASREIPEASGTKVERFKKSLFGS